MKKKETSGILRWLVCYALNELKMDCWVLVEVCSPQVIISFMSLNHSECDVLSICEEHFSQCFNIL